MSIFTIYLGTKHDQNRVRCLRKGDIYYYPPQNHNITWEMANDDFVSILYADNASITVAKEKTENSSFQCWSIQGNTENVLKGVFIALIANNS